MNIHKYVRDFYAKRFTELESIVFNPVDYARAVKIIGNVDNLSKITDQLSFMPNNTIMSACVAFHHQLVNPCQIRIKK
jgi:U4/U6 small nuclear ribonucleoprotein PRP31